MDGSARRSKLQSLEFFLFCLFGFRDCGGSQPERQ
jgi:hypothetical protein